MNANKVEQLRKYIEENHTGYRINGAYANGIGQGALISIGNQRENNKNEWEFIGESNFIANDNFINETISNFYITILSGKNTALNNSEVNKESFHQWVKDQVTLTI